MSKLKYYLVRVVQNLNFPFVFIFLLRIFPVRRHKVFCINFIDKGFRDNPRYIIEALVKHNDQSYEVVWSAGSPNILFPEYVKIVAPFSLRWFYHVATSGIWISNVRMPRFVRKRKGQFYVQTWHGIYGIKETEQRVEGRLSRKYIARAKNDSQMIDIIPSGSTKMTDYYQQQFWYDGDILELGTPRCDVLLSDEYKRKAREEIADRYQVHSSEKIVLYAPTFRAESRTRIHGLSPSEIKGDLAQNLKWLFRYHPNTLIEDRIPDHVVNCTKYPDVQRLLASCDIFITDYSSMAFEALIAGKDVVLYIPDVNDYITTNRTLSEPLDQLPFTIVHSQSELVKLLTAGQFADSRIRRLDFFQKIGSFETGSASKGVADLIAATVARK